MNSKCKGPEVETCLANGKVAWRQVAEWDWGGKQRGCGCGGGRGLGVTWDIKGHGEVFESYSDGDSVLPQWLEAEAESNPRVGGWKGKKSRNISRAARGPSLNGGPVGWPWLPQEPSDLHPPPPLSSAQELEAAAGDLRRKLTVLGVSEHPEELGLVSGNKSRYIGS